jgi:CheY-like chemotaxis protein
MNILVHDDPPAVGRLVRAALAGRSHRASIAASAGEARRKLETGLFDAMVIGAGGASREIAELLESEWPDLPLVLAGVEREVPCAGPIVAVLTRPIRLDALRDAVRALESRIPARGRDIDAVLVAAGVHIPGRVVGRGRGNLLFEPSSETTLGDGDRVTVRCGGSDLAADLVFTDAAPRGGARFVAVHIGDAAAFEKFASNQPGGVAC